MQYIVQILEDGHRTPISGTFDTLEAAQEKARKCVDDALPNNTVQILAVVGSAYLGGDGDSYLSSPAPEQRAFMAAPDLLAAVKHFVAVCDSNGYCKRGRPPHTEDSPPLAAARAAIALAEVPS